MKRRSPMATRNNTSSSVSSVVGTSPVRNLNRQFQLEQEGGPAASEITSTARFRIVGDNDDDDDGSNKQPPNFYDDNNADINSNSNDKEHNDTLNYALLVVLYTMQGIPMGLSASIPFLIQQKARQMAAEAAAAVAASSGAAAAGLSAAAAIAATTGGGSTAAAAATKLSYNANAIFALCSWPFSLKLLWAPVVDACFFRAFGRRKSWLVPVQAMAGTLMVLGAPFVERQFDPASHADTLNVGGVTAFFFALYFLMATQDIAVDGWALTLLSKKNRGRGPVCNSIGQNLGYFLSFVGFLALNDAESSDRIWRPLLGLAPTPPGEIATGLVSLGGFVRFMGYFMLITTTAVALFKHEASSPARSSNRGAPTMGNDVEDGRQLPLALLASDRMGQQWDDDDDKYSKDEQGDELDASEIGLKETYHRLWAVCKLPAVRSLFFILFTYRLPTSLTDNVKFLKAVELGLSKSTTALLSPTVILPIGIFVPILATRIWHGNPLKQFMTAYKFRVTLVPLLDVLMLLVLKRSAQHSSSSFGSSLVFWSILVLSTAASSIANTLQFNAQMTFFAHRVDPAIGGSYMTLLNTAANLGGTWPASFVMMLVSRLTPVVQQQPQPQDHREALVAEGVVNDNGVSAATARATGGLGGLLGDPYFAVQLVFSLLGLLWIWFFGKSVSHVADLPDDAWRTHLLDDGDGDEQEALVASSTAVDVELAGGITGRGAATAMSTTRNYGGKRE